MAFSVTTAAFGDGDRVPVELTCDGKDHPPDITVSDPPPGTRGFALIMDDPDAPRGTFTHWLAYDIPMDGEVLRTSDAKSLKNDFGKTGYGGPCPPPGHGAHRYYFTVYAVDVPRLDVKGGTREALQDALTAHTLAMARVMGRYERRP